MKLHRLSGPADGDAIVLLHGYGADRFTWIGQAPVLASVAQVYSVDLPGHGDSFEDVVPDTIDAISVTLLNALDANGIQRVHLVAHSFGGAVAMAFTAAYADRVQTLSLIAAAGLGDSIDDQFLKRFPQLQAASDIVIELKRLVHNPRLINAQLGDTVLQQLERPGARVQLQRVAELLRRFQVNSESKVMQFRKPSVPRLVIWGRQDQINPISSRRLERFGGKLQVIESCGHLPHIEHRTKVNKWLLDFLQSGSLEHGAART